MAGKRNQSVSDFPPEFFDIWMLAANGSLRLSFESSGKATNFKQRLYTFRKRLLQESPAMAQEFAGVDLKVERGETPQQGAGALLVPYVPEWKKQVAAAKNTLGEGLSLPAAPLSQIPPDISIPASAPISTLGETLSHLGFGSETDVSQQKTDDSKG